jgi:hypothetical protein
MRTRLLIAAVTTFLLMQTSYGQDLAVKLTHILPPGGHLEKPTYLYMWLQKQKISTNYLMAFRALPRERSINDILHQYTQAPLSGDYKLEISCSFVDGDQFPSDNIISVPFHLTPTASTASIDASCVDLNNGKLTPVLSALHIN